MITFKELFNEILTANQEVSRKAAREVRKLLHASQSRGKFEEIKNIISNAPDEYLKISESWRQENFAMAVSVIYFLHERGKESDYPFPWLFGLLQHENGNIRQAAVRMIVHELGPLTVHIRFPNEQSLCDEFSPKQADRLLLGLYIGLNNLLAVSWKPAYKKYKYISALPSSTYKSSQMIMGELIEDCGPAYVKSMEDYANRAYSNI